MLSFGGYLASYIVYDTAAIVLWLVLVQDCRRS